jgi:hypothetical protein
MCPAIHAAQNAVMLTVCKHESWWEVGWRSCRPVLLRCAPRGGRSPWRRVQIAAKELREGKIPFIVRRHLPDGRCAPSRAGVADAGAAGLLAYSLMWHMHLGAGLTLVVQPHQLFSADLLALLFSLIQPSCEDCWRQCSFEDWKVSDLIQPNR